LGREEELAAVVAALSDGGDTRALAVIAAGGLGKTALTVDAGWALLRSGAFGQGCYVDLREAGDADSVAARFAAGLWAEKGSPEAVRDCVRAMVDAAAADGGGGGGGNLLMLVDNVEDALGEAGAAGCLRKLLAAVLAASPRARLLITSRAPLATEGVREMSLAPLGDAKAALVVAAAAPKLPAADAAAVVRAAAGNSLQLRLLADALATGRITVQAREALCC
jgi:hypothetical protein